VIAYFLCPETLTALLLLSRQAGGYQDVVKEVGLEPAIKLAKSTASESKERSAKSLLVCCLAKVRGCQECTSLVVTRKDFVFQ